MTTSIETAVREFHDRVTEVQRVIEVIEEVTGRCPESDLNGAVWALIGGYMAAIGHKHHCEGWLDWWWTECDLGNRPKEAAPAGGKLRKVETINDLVALILEEQK